MKNWPFALVIPLLCCLTSTAGAQGQPPMPMQHIEARVEPEPPPNIPRNKSITYCSRSNPKSWLALRRRFLLRLISSSKDCCPMTCKIV